MKTETLTGHAERCWMLVDDNESSLFLLHEIVSQLERLKKNCSRSAARNFGVLARLSEGACPKRSVTERKRSQNPKEPLPLFDQPNGYSFSENALGIPEILCFRSPLEALAQFQTAPESFEMVITDFQMPDLNGVELGRRLRSAAPQIKIILVTSSDLISDAAVAREGFCALLKKPLHPAALKNALNVIAIPAQ